MKLNLKFDQLIVARRPAGWEVSRSEIFSAIFSKMSVQKVLGQQIKWYFELFLFFLLNLPNTVGCCTHVHFIEGKYTHKVSNECKIGQGGIYFVKTRGLVPLGHPGPRACILWLLALYTVQSALQCLTARFSFQLAHLKCFATGSNEKQTRFSSNEMLVK